MIAHLLCVSGLVLELGGSEDEAIAALLHDAAENAGGRERVMDIRRHFGAEVARMVEECTDSDDETLSWQERKADYMAHLPTAGTDSLLVSAVDKLSNVRQICVAVRTRGVEAWTDYSGGREGRLWYYEALVTAYEKAGERRATPHLREAVSVMIRLGGSS